MQEHPYFFGELTKQRLPLADLLRTKRAFAEVPAAWSVVMVDVIGSTRLVELGMHHDINLAATGGIVAVLNGLRSVDAKLKVPYFFGGDGATFLVPPHVLDTVLDALEKYQHHIDRGLSLRLKVGAHSVQGVYEHGHTLRIARWAVNEQLTLPVVLGTGIKFAEEVIKATTEDVLEDLAQVASPDLGGMECRWDEVAPPKRQHKVICLVANCTDDATQAPTYAALAEGIDCIFGRHEQRQPISGAKLKLDLAVSKIKREMLARMGRLDLWYWLKHWVFTLFGPAYFRYSKGGRAYLEQVIALSHTLMIDGSFHCVITGTEAQAAALIALLDDMEREERLRYGLHITWASVMSCYVVDRVDDHAHFVDGTDGGFTAAAVAYKAKLRKGEEAQP